MCSLKITKAEGGVRRVVPGGPDPLDTPAMLIPYQTSYPNPHAVSDWTDSPVNAWATYTESVTPESRHMTYDMADTKKLEPVPKKDFSNLQECR